VINSTFTGNTSTYSNYGAAISDFGGTLTVAGSTFANNVATGVDSSGALAVGRFGQAATTATISSSTFTGNSGTAAGAIGTSSLATGTGVTSLTAQTSTFSGNTASAGAGAIEIDETSPVTGTVVSSTFSGNTAPAATGTAIDAATAAATIGVADNLINGTCSGVGTFTDYGFNAAIDASCFEAAGPTDAVSASLGSSLGSLSNNGGATQTIQPGGVAINLIPARTSQSINGVTGVGCPTTDQTGYTVAANTPCNAGSLQQQPPTFASPASGTLAIATLGSVSIVSVGSPAATLTEAGALPAGVTFHPGTAGTATLSGTPAAGTGGTYSIVVTATNGLGAAQQAFSLTVTPVTAMFGGATTISGTPALNATLTCVGAPVYGSLITETYSWHVGTTAHNGSNQLKDVAADVGKQITCTVTASNAGGKVSSTSAAVIG
jgi:Putative Ig domain